MSGNGKENEELQELVVLWFEVDAGITSIVTCEAGTEMQSALRILRHGLVLREGAKTTVVAPDCIISVSWNEKEAQKSVRQSEVFE